MGCVTKGSSSVSENGGFIPSNLWQFQWGQLINYSGIGDAPFSDQLIWIHFRCQRVQANWTD